MLPVGSYEWKATTDTNTNNCVLEHFNPIETGGERERERERGGGGVGV